MPPTIHAAANSTATHPTGTKWPRLLELCKVDTNTPATHPTQRHHKATKKTCPLMSTFCHAPSPPWSSKYYSPHFLRKTFSFNRTSWVSVKSKGKIWAHEYFSFGSRLRMIHRLVRMSGEISSPLKESTILNA